MKSILQRIWLWIRGHKAWSVVIGLAILIVVLFLIFGGKNKVVTATATVERGTIKEEVSVTGNVKPLSDVDLAFERGGRVSVLSVAVGDKVYVGQYLASVSNADLTANVDQAKANLKKVQAQLETTLTNRP